MDVTLGPGAQKELIPVKRLGRFLGQCGQQPFDLLEIVMPPSSRRAHAVLYYSLSGHTDRVARRIADELDADLLRIVTRRYGRGALLYLKAGFDSLTGRLPPIGPVDNLSSYESVSLGAPIWTGYPALPLRSYLSRHPSLPKAVGLFVTSGGPSAPLKGYSMARELLGHPFVATLSVPNGLDAPTTKDRITTYCDAIRAAAGAAALA